MNADSPTRIRLLYRAFFLPRGTHWYGPEYPLKKEDMGQNPTSQQTWYITHRSKEKPNASHPYILTN